MLIAFLSVLYLTKWEVNTSDVSILLPVRLKETWKEREKSPHNGLITFLQGANKSLNFRPAQPSPHTWVNAFSNTTPAKPPFTN